MKSNGVSSLINSQRSERSITSADTDEMEEFDDESSGVEGSDDSEEPKVEDTISLDSDSEPEPNVDSTTATGSKQPTEEDDVEEILSDNNSGDDEEVVEDKQETSEIQSTPIANGVKDLTSKQSIQNNSTEKKTPSVSILNDTISFNKGSLSITHIKSSKSTNSAVNPTALFERFAARGTTVTPIVNKTNTTSATVQAPSIVLQSLSDDMFVVEAPSFIVPYVYEKPSVKPFRKFVDELEKEIKKLKAEEAVIVDEEKLNSVDEDDHSEKGPKRPDDASASDSEAASDAEKNSVKESEQKDPSASAPAAAPRIKSDNYFENPLGKFFMNIGSNLVQEYVQNDLLKQQKRKLKKERKSGLSSTKNTESTIKSLIQNLEYSQDSNAPYKFEQKKCEICDFKSESAIVVAHHLETPHMKNNIYKCNFCKFEIRSPHDILFHIEAAHNVNARLVRALAYHQCANCPFEDNAKGKLARHLIGCAKRFKPEINLAPPVEWEPPAKLPKMREVRKNMMGSGSVYMPTMTRPKGQLSMLPNPLSIAGMPPLTFAKGALDGRTGVTIRPTLPLNANKSRGYPNLISSQVNQLAKMAGANKVVQGPSRAPPPLLQPKPVPAPANFVVCEICDGYIQDLEMLRHHMQWIHKIKIHPKLIFSRPPLNCQKCQLRFFTDQGLERHLLGSHGLVTSSMQEAANKGKDAGRCPVCGKSYQHNLLSHVSREHKMTLKPAHLSYKCTVCTAKFTMYKQFEEHVYSAHSVVAKRIADKNKLNSTPKQASMVR